MYPAHTPYRDGITHFVFEPIEFLARLAALVPRPRGRYHGILAPNAIAICYCGLILGDIASGLLSQYLRSRR